MDKRLFRNEHDKVIAGVSSGIAEYMEVDVTIIRLLFVLSTFFLVGVGIMVYIVMWIVVPVNNDPASRFGKFKDFYQKQQYNPFNSGNPFTQPPNPAGSTGPTQSWTSSTVNEGSFNAAPKPGDFKPPFPKQNNETGRTVGGLFLLVIGMYFLMNEFNIIPFWFSLGKLWPLVFVAIGVSFILKSKQKNAWEEWKRQQEQEYAAGPANTATPDVTPITPEAVPVIPANDPIVSEGDTAPKMDDRFTKKDI